MSSKRPIRGKYDSSTTDEEEEMNDVSPRRSYRETASRKQYQEKVIMDDDIVPEPRRRVRGPSKRPCLNRNALMARENRQRKKEYLQKIENKLLFYQQENKNLANIIQKQGIDIKRLTGEVAYLKNVLHNNTAISALLKSINISLKKRCTCFTNDIKMQDLDTTNVGIIPEGNHQDSKCKIETQNSVMGCCCTDSGKHMNCRLPVAKKTAHSFTESDHTYTAPKDFSSVNMESQFDGRHMKPVNGLNGIHLTHSASNDYGDMKNTVNKTITDAIKLEDNKTLMDNTNILGNAYTADDTTTRTQLTNVDKNLSNIRRIKDRESVTENVDNRNMLEQKSTIDQKSLMEADNLMLMSSASSMNSEPAKDCDSGQFGLDPLLPFNMDIFEDIPKCDEFVNSIEDLEDDPGLFTDENLLQNLNNTGICLHVNSDKVSLEFCSVCHLNSANSEIA